MASNPLLILFGIYIVIGLIVNRAVVLDSGLGRFQKFAQTLIIWLIPVFGMSIVLLMLGNGHTRADMKRLVPFPFYLVAPAVPRDGGLSGPAQDGFIDDDWGGGADGGGD